MLTIRYKRIGKKNQPSFRIVVTDKRKSSTGGKPIEELGFYNPLTKQKKINAERAKYWVSIGAKPSDTIFNLLIKEKIIEGKKIPLHKKSKKKQEDKAATPSKEEPKVQEAPKEEPKAPEAPKAE